MGRWTFGKQMAAVVLVMGLAVGLARFTGEPVFKNFGWVISGALFAANPVSPRRVGRIDPEHLRLGLRVGGFVAATVGIVTRFG